MRQIKTHETSDHLHMKYTTRNFVLLLSPMVLGLSFAMDIYVPALPHIATLFHVSAGKMQLTLTFFMITAGFMQLIVGPLSDHYGRKKVAFIVTALFACATLLCSFAHNITELILFRILQAIGSCGMMVVAFAIVRDIFSGPKSAQTYSFLNGIIAFSPMLAPFIGSYLDVKLGWPATFQALLVIAAFSWIHLTFFIPETLPLANRNKFTSSLLGTYGTIIRHPAFLSYTFSTAAGLSYLYLFCSISPYIIIRLLHIPELNYGYYFCFMGISFFIGSMISGYIVTYLGIFKTVLLGFFITLIGGIWMAGWYFVTGLTIHNFVWPMLPLGIGGTICMGAGNGGAMEPFSINIGAAAALGGAIRFIFAGILGSFLIRSSVQSTFPLAIPAILFSLIGLCLFLIKHKTLNMTENNK